MGYEARHIRVFLSSSMDEFRREREAIKQELDRRGILNFVFEQEGASGEDPGSRFREAVQGASVYIGIFGKACGAYTRQEFELAQEQQITCHLYVQDIADEERSQELNHFLKTLSGVSNVPSLFYFLSTEKLAGRIIQDLWSWVDRLVGKIQEQQTRGQQDRWLDQEITDHLPILCDRDPQEIQFETLITSYFRACSTRPFLLILPGPVEEGHGLYVNRVKFSSLEEYLNKAGITGEKRIKHFRKSPCAMTSTANIRSEIVSLLKEKSDGSDEVIIDHARKHRLKALVFVIRVLASECEGNPQASLQLIAKYWAEFPHTQDTLLLGAVVCLEEDRSHDEPQGWWQRIFGGKGNEESEEMKFQQVAQDIQQQYQDGDLLRVHLLPRLDSPKAADVRRWLDHDLVKAVVPFVPGKDIEALFDKRESLPMEDLYGKLSDLLKNRKG